MTHLERKWLPRCKLLTGMVNGISFNEVQHRLVLSSSNEAEKKVSLDILKDRYVFKRF